MRLFNRILPSFKASSDPVVQAVPDAVLKPVLIDEIKLILPIRRMLNRFRSQPVAPVRKRGKRLTVVIPFRDRDAHLRELLPALAGHLRGQGIDFEIIVVEQEFGKAFNRGMLKNIGAKEARPDTDYFCFHDVDMVPIEADYSYCSHPVRLVTSVERSFKVNGFLEDGRAFPHYFGGVIAISKENFCRVNGYSNEYWSWGAEDDELLMRLLFAGIVPVYDEWGRYRALFHEPASIKDRKGRISHDGIDSRMLLRMEQSNRKRYRKYKRGLTGNESGLRNVRYRVLRGEERGGYKVIAVSI